MNGASARRARRRAISVLPTPVGPIIRMFFGAISLRSGSATCWRRQRLRSATATARLARCWPTMCLFNSWTISFGVIIGGANPRAASFERLDRLALIGVDAQVGGDRQRARHDVGWRQVRVVQQGTCRGLGVRVARAD